MSGALSRSCVTGQGAGKQGLITNPSNGLQWIAIQTKHHQPRSFLLRQSLQPTTAMVTAGPGTGFGCRQGDSFGCQTGSWLCALIAPFFFFSPLWHCQKPKPPKQAEHSATASPTLLLH